MKTINPKSRDHQALLRQIGGRIVETCFTCVYDRCTQHGDFNFVSSTTHMIFVCNRHVPVNDDFMSTQTLGIAGKPGCVPRTATPGLDTRPKQKLKKISPGCYVTTVPLGKAVCTEIGDAYITIRYEAVRCSDQKIIWVENRVRAADCTYLQKADKQSRAVLKMRGPYGEE